MKCAARDTARSATRGANSCEIRRAGDNFEQHDSSFTQTIKSNELGQCARKQFLYIFSWISSLLIDNGFGSFLSLAYIGQGLDRAEVTLAHKIEELV
jgi:hypothetical protein